MDSNKQIEMESNKPSPKSSRIRIPRLADALAYSESESGRAASAEPSTEQAQFAEHLQGRAVSHELFLEQPSTLYSESVELLSGEMSSQRAASLNLSTCADLSSGQAAFLYLASRQETEHAASLHLSTGQDAALVMSPRRSSSLRMSTGQDATLEMSPARSTSLHLSTGRDVTLEMTPGRETSLHLSPRRDVTLEMTHGRSTSLHLSSGRDATLEMSSLKSASLHLPPGRDAMLEMTPVKSTSLHMSPQRDRTFELSPVKSASLHMSQRRDATLDTPPGRSTSLHLSTGRDATLEMSPGRSTSIYSLSGRNASTDISLGRSVLLHLSPRRTASLHQSPEHAESYGISPGRSASLNQSLERATLREVLSGEIQSETVTRRIASNTTLVEDGPHQKRNFSRTSTAAKKHVPATHKLDLVSGRGSAIGSPEPTWNGTAYRVQASPLSFGAMPLPPIQGSGQKEESRADMRKPEVERRKVGKERELQEIKSILSTQMNAFAERQVTGNDLRILSRLRNEDSLNVSRPLPLVEKDSNKLIVSKKVKTKPARTPQTSLKPPSQPKSKIIVRETKASKLRKNVQKEQPVVTRRVLPPVNTPINPPAGPVVVQGPQRRVLSPEDSSRISSESPPPTPVKLGPPRPDFVPRLDLSFLLTPEDYPSGTPIPPPVIAIRETKASKLRRLKKAEEEKKSNSLGKTEKTKVVASEHSLETIQRTRTPTFKPSLPKSYKKPVPVVRETKASKLRKNSEIKKAVMK